MQSIVQMVTIVLQPWAAQMMMHACWQNSFKLQRGTAGRVVSLHTPVAYKGHAKLIYISFSKHTLSTLSAASGTRRSR